MCLQKVNEQYDKPSGLILGGHKKFMGSGSKPQFEAQMLRGKKEVPLDEWIKAETATEVDADDGVKYEAGFHVYEDDTKEMNRSPYRRVFVRYVSARGEEASSYNSKKKIMIAREMYVPSDEKNGWPPKPGEPLKKQVSTLDKIKSAIKPGEA